MCGGAHSGRNDGLFNQGLSPRVRGSPYFRSVGAPCSRSIPACAGEPSRAHEWPGCWSGGSIPACAGEPVLSFASYLSIPVYPRVCGGAILTSYTSLDDQGLSPRVRGSHLDVDTRLVFADTRSIPACAGEPPDAPARPVKASRSIPACAGEPTNPDSQSVSEQVYPRVCGGAILRSPMSFRDRSLRVYPRVCGGALDFPGP